MTQDEVNNALKYALLALAAFAVGCATALVPQLMDPSMPVLNWRIVLGTGIAAVVTAYGSAFLPRKGSTGLAAQVDALKAQGVPRSRMVVLSDDDAAVALANGRAEAAFSPVQVAQIADEIEARLKAMPSEPTEAELDDERRAQGRV